ncbi:MAG: hypothetical protein D6768_00030 [Chloroflexi bacterium]|nr:MAG: hypothetical protein D6768_00030 [Chloroflexota bacterium]
MFSPEVNYWVSQEQHRDRLLELERHRLVRLVENQKPGRHWHRKASRRLGRRLQQWGHRLEGYGSSATPKTAPADT